MRTNPVTITIEADSAQQLMDAIAMLKLGAGEALTGRELKADEEGGPHAFLGLLEVGELPNLTPFLLALIRGMLVNGPTERNVSAVAGRVWLATHCSMCGHPIEQTEESIRGDGLCTDCDLLNSRPGGLGRLARTERIRIDHETIMAFLKDPDATEGERDQFYLLMMAQELVKTAHEGYEAHGRGAIVLDQTGRRPFQAFYVDMSTASGTGIGWPSPEVEHFVQEYDPLSEMIVVFLKPNDLPVTYRMGCESVDWFNPGDRGKPPRTVNPFGREADRKPPAA